MSSKGKALKKREHTDIAVSLLNIEQEPFLPIIAQALQSGCFLPGFEEKLQENLTVLTLDTFHT